MKKSMGCVLAMTLIFASGCGAFKVVKPEKPSGPQGTAHNLGFEEGQPGKQEISGWRYTQSGDYVVEVADDIKRSGKQSAHIRAEGEGSWGAFNQDYKGPAFAGKTVRVKAWIKVEGTEVCGECNKPNLDESVLPEDARKGAQVRILGFGDDVFASETLVTPLVMGTQDWTLYEATAQMPAEITLAIVAPVLWGPGKAWFDDLEITAE